MLVYSLPSQLPTSSSKRTKGNCIEAPTRCSTPRVAMQGEEMWKDKGTSMQSVSTCLGLPWVGSLQLGAVRHTRWEVTTRSKGYPTVPCFHNGST